MDSMIVILGGVALLALALLLFQVQLRKELRTVENMGVNQGFTATTLKAIVATGSQLLRYGLALYLLSTIWAFLYFRHECTQQNPMLDYDTATFAAQALDALRWPTYLDQQPPCTP
ncbi:MAG: hypothetical protein GXY36_19985 [Chloroflexi bacterium]|nr:hypothetical protein [Chloroflexota bacterium]